MKRTRETIEADLRAYLASGREITKVPRGVSGELSWDDYRAKLKRHRRRPLTVRGA